MIFITFQQSHGLGGDEILFAGFGVVGCHLRRFHRDVSRSDMSHHFLKGEWLAEEIALDLFAADGFQEFELFLCLHAFRQGADADGLRHGHGGFDDVFRPLGEAGEECHVDFQFIEMVIFQRIERGVAATEVVHPYLEARCAESFQADADFTGVLHKHTLGDFYAQQRVRNLIFRSDFFDFFINVAGQKVHAGQVEGNRDGRDAVVQAMALSLADEL